MNKSYFHLVGLVSVCIILGVLDASEPATKNSVVPMKAAFTEKPMIVASALARILVAAHLDGGLAELVQEIEGRPSHYKEQLKEELIEQRRIDFLRFPPRDNYNLRGLDGGDVICRLNQYNFKILILDSSVTTVIYEDGQVIAIPHEKDWGKPLSAAWIDASSYVAVFERAILKYEFNWQEGTFNMVGKDYDDFLIRSANRSCTQYICEITKIVGHLELKEGKALLPLACGTIDRDVRSSEELQMITKCGLNSWGITQFAVSDYGDVIVGQNGSQYIYVLTRSETNGEFRFIEEPIMAPGSVSTTTCDAQGQKIAFVADGKVHIAHVRTRAIEQVIGTSNIPVTCLAFEPSSRYLFVGLTNGVVFAFDLELRIRSIFVTTPEPIVQISFVPERNLILMSSEASVVILGLKSPVENTLNWRQALFFLKACQYSYEAVSKHPSFEGVLEELSGSEESAPLVSYIRESCGQCTICNDRRANAETSCKHKMCEQCLIKTIKDAPVCPLCRNIIRHFMNLQGQVQVSYTPDLKIC